MLLLLLGCVDDRDCAEEGKICNHAHVCESLICPTPVDEIASAKLRYNHDVHKVGTTAQMICLAGYIYNFARHDERVHGGGEEYIPVKQVNLHCTRSSNGGKAIYVDDYGHTPYHGCTKGKGMSNTIHIACI